MQKLDPDKLFGIFQANDEDVYREHGVSHLLQNPYVMMGMVVKNLENYEILHMNFSKEFGEEYQKIEHKIKIIYFTRLFNYLSRIAINDFHIEAGVGDIYDRDKLFYSLNCLLTYFESVEQYEKCSKVKLYIDTLLSDSWES